MITNIFWINLYDVVCFSLTVHLLHNCSEQNFVELHRSEAVKHSFANSQVFILFNPVLHTIVIATASS